ncbi:Ig-like domain-containing protein [Archaeoglobus veneficus]|uniref:Uncharacterized protein n=1 Tax=Archaeoglobus veneficus (strain DSM 11195 / SNP6) TaxID=693661 RepID=F2KT24_ARCVS|nr:Ig-like domain-containing protein [Archaeoglobus veneficus]AEA47054.1 hypothetical protein Arcve_1043 [Archaeoglobus veneficus SNP6]
MQDRAISPVVGMVMILAIVAGFMSIVQTQQLPQWNKQKEAEHYKLLVSEFSRIPYILSTGSTASISLDAGLNYPDVPLLVNPPDALSTLQFEERNITVKCKIILPDNTEKNFERKYNSTAIRLIPHYFYSPERELVLEHGVVFEKWANSNKPIPVTDQITFTKSRINIPIIDASDGSVTAAKFSLKLSPASYGGEVIAKDINVTFETEFVDWWYECLKKIFGEGNVTNGTNYVTVIIPEAIIDVSSYVVGDVIDDFNGSSEVQRKLEMLIPFQNELVVSSGDVERIDVQAVDNYGNPISGLVINASVNPSGLGDVTQSATTNSRGIASFYFTAGGAGDGTIEFNTVYRGVSKSVTVNVTVVGNVAIGIIGIEDNTGGKHGHCHSSSTANSVTFKHFGGSNLTASDVTVILYVNGDKANETQLSNCLSDSRFEVGDEAVVKSNKDLTSGSIVTVVLKDKGGRIIGKSAATFVP